MFKQKSSQARLQQLESASHTQVSHDAASQPPPSWVLQQSPPGVSTGVLVGVGGAHAQLEAHWPSALREQKSSHAVAQQSGSAPHTHAWQEVLSQPGPPWATQQAPPGVGDGVGVLVGTGVPHGQLVAHWPFAASEQKTSQAVSQQKESMPHTHA